jgi:hypothetical protein
MAEHKIKRRKPIDQNRPCWLYWVVNRESGKAYIGISIDIGQRFSNHKTILDKDYCPDSPLYRALKKYGVEGFAWTPIRLYPSIAEAKQVERDTIVAGFGYYNATGGGDGCYLPSEETREKMAAAKRGRPSNNKNIVVMNEARRGIPRTAKEKQSIREGWKFVVDNALLDIQTRSDNTRAWHDRMSLEEKQEISSKLSKKSSEWWASRTVEQLQAFSEICSLAQTGLSDDKKLAKSQKLSKAHADRAPEKEAERIRKIKATMQGQGYGGGSGAVDAFVRWRETKTEEQELNRRAKISATAMSKSSEEKTKIYSKASQTRKSSPPEVKLARRQKLQDNAAAKRSAGIKRKSPKTTEEGEASRRAKISATMSAKTLEQKQTQADKIKQGHARRTPEQVSETNRKRRVTLERKKAEKDSSQ